MGAAWILLLFTALAQVVEAVRSGGSLWPAVVTAALALAFLPVGWFWVIVPYLKSEKWYSTLWKAIFFRKRRFGDGNPHTFPASADEVGGKASAVSPADRSEQKTGAVSGASESDQSSFSYNTLESIRGEALIAGLDSVADMTEALAKFFRYTITKVENLVSVEEELDNCETYFGIQKYRFGESAQPACGV